jgi:hypothetical protein
MITVYLQNSFLYKFCLAIPDSSTYTDTQQQHIVSNSCVSLLELSQR